MRKKKSKVITISRQLKVSNKLKNYLEDNMWYRRRIYNKLVELYREWDKTSIIEAEDFDWKRIAKDIQKYEKEEFDYFYYCTGIREKCIDDLFECSRRVKAAKSYNMEASMKFTRYDKYAGSFRVSNKITAHKKDNPTSGKCMIRDESHIHITFNKNNKQILELKEPLKFKMSNEQRVMFTTFTSGRYRFQNKDIKEVAFVKKLNKYYINFIVEVEILDYDKQDRNFLAGIDLGLRNPVTLCYLDDNDKEVIEKFNMSDKEYRHMKHLENRITRLSQIMSRKMLINKERVKKGELNTVYTRNYEKVRNKFRISHRKLFNVKRNWRLKLAHYIVNHYDNIVVDEFNSITRNFSLPHSKYANKKSAKLGMYYFITYLRWMTDKYKCNFIESPNNTTKTCCKCGFVNKHLKLGEKYLKCKACDTVIDRDVNAAYNCFKYGLKNIYA